MKHILTINPLKEKTPKIEGCRECPTSCQSACKTSCTVGNQVCMQDQKSSVNSRIPEKANK